MFKNITTAFLVIQVFDAIVNFMNFFFKGNRGIFSAVKTIHGLVPLAYGAFTIIIFLKYN